MTKLPAGPLRLDDEESKEIARRAAKAPLPKLEAVGRTYRSKLPGTRGKPRRGRVVAEVSTVRIDAEAKAVLAREFGSLGNALYYIYSGLVQFRSLHGLSQHPETATGPKDPKGAAGFAASADPDSEPYLFSYADLRQIAITVSRALESGAVDAAEARGLGFIKQKLFDYLSPPRVRAILKAEKERRNRFVPIP